MLEGWSLTWLAGGPAALPYLAGLDLYALCILGGGGGGGRKAVVDPFVGLVDWL